MGLASLAERLTRKTWTPEIVDAYVGAVEGSYLTHAADDTVREAAASGGAVSAVLLSELSSGRADGALVCATVVRDGRVRAEYRIATTAEEVLAARGSTYVLGDFIGEAIPLIEAFDGRVAVVGLPCEITAISKRPEVAAKVSLLVALFCGHATTPELVDRVTARMAGENGAALTGFRFRKGHWRGVMRAEFDDGSAVERPFSAYGTYQNLYVCAAKKCMFCGDHFGYDADMSAGDIWSAAYKSDPVKHTAVVTKSSKAESALAVARESGRLVVEDLPITEVLDGQRRAAPFHYNTTARALEAGRYGMKIPERKGVSARWHERLAARIALRNYVLSQTPEGLDRIMGRSRRLLKLELLVLKGLESLS